MVDRPTRSGETPVPAEAEGAQASDTGFGRRTFLKTTLSGAAAAATWRATGPFIRHPEAQTLELSWLGWEHYNLDKLTSAFEKEFGCRVSAGFFDGNSEAYNKLRAGGVKDFDLVMADGFWPRLYVREGLCQPVDYGQIPNLENVFDDFKPPQYNLLQAEGGGDKVAAPNCWGGYGFTVNMNEVDEKDADSVSLLFNAQYDNHLSTSARYEENIALAGILAAHELGTKNAERPDGKDFNPYVLTDKELQRAKELLIKQKGLLVTRWQSTDELERLLRSRVVWASPEWSGIYRRIHFDRLDGETDLNMAHVLRPKEGGLGWVDAWSITAGVEHSEKRELAHQWINFRLRPENMATVATDIGWAPTVDVRDRIPQRYVKTLFLNNTEAIQGLYQFDKPSDPEHWERIWSEVEAA